ncbi:MAG: hypothetical protein KDB27_32085 [Planctomycetales bacterium]|nr:hypothetical protein [Planctomycetales bacterium]
MKCPWRTNVHTRIAVVLAAFVSCSGVSTAQVQTLDRVPSSNVHQAGCDCNAGQVIHDASTVYSSGCDSCSDCCGGTVWGTQCISSCPPCGAKIGLFPPCPNPCDTCYIADKLRGLDCGLKSLFGKLLGPKGCNACDTYGCDGGCLPLLHAGACSMCCSAPDCTGCADCSGGAVIGSGTVVQPAPAEGQPQPAPAEGADPFQDDSASLGPRPIPNTTGPQSHVRRAAHFQPIPGTAQSEPRRNALRRTPSGLFSNLLPIGGTGLTNKQASAPSANANAQRSRAPRQYRNRRAAAMRPVANASAPRLTLSAPSQASAKTPQPAINQSDDALLKFVD